MRSRREALLARLADAEEKALFEELASSTDSHGHGNSDEAGVSVDHSVVPDLPWLSEAALSPPESLPPEPLREEDEREWPDDESVRPDIAEFYLYNGANDGDGGNRRKEVRREPEDVAARRRRTPDAPRDERSMYTDSYAASSFAREDIESYYFRVPDHPSDDENESIRDDGESQARPSFVDEERSQAMRARLIARVDAMYGKEKLPPVPKLRPF